jgi:hypothetical protein
MRLHAQLTPEAEAKRAAQQRASTVLSVVTALLFMTLIGVILALCILVPRVDQAHVFATYHPPGERIEEVTQKQIQRVQPKPSSPRSAQSMRNIVSLAASPVSIPIPEIEPVEFTADLGTMDDFGEGVIGDGLGMGAGAGGGGGFGTTNPNVGGLRGRLFDFKQTDDKKPNRDYIGSEIYVEIAERIQRRKFADGAFSKYFQAPLELTLTHLAVPFTAAAEGPRYFGAEELMQPSGWMAHYRGDLVVPETGRYRFVGMGDDYMSLFIDGRLRLVACWPDIQPRLAGRWDAAEESGQWASPVGNQKLLVGDWVSLKKGQIIEMDLGIGERPGGMVGFVLMVEKQGESYAKDDQGRPILPLFTTQPFTPEEVKELQSKYGNYRFEWEKVPVFRTKG